MEDKSFDGPVDQAAHRVEMTVLAAVAFVDWWVILDHAIEPKGLGVLVRTLFFPFLILSLLGAYAYTLAVYRLGRIHWAPRVLLNAAVLIFFLLAVVAPLRK